MTRPVLRVGDRPCEQRAGASPSTRRRRRCRPTRRAPGPSPRRRRARPSPRSPRRQHRGSRSRGARGRRPRSRARGPLYTRAHIQWPRASLASLPTWRQCQAEACAVSMQLVVLCGRAVLDLQQVPGAVEQPDAARARWASGSSVGRRRRGRHGDVLGFGCGRVDRGACGRSSAVSESMRRRWSARWSRAVRASRRTRSSRRIAPRSPARRPRGAPGSPAG